MKWFGAAKREPGWLAIALSEAELRYVHGRYEAAGKSAIARFGSASFEAKSGAADRERSRRAGLDHHLVKPVDPSRLEELLNRAALA